VSLDLDTIYGLLPEVYRTRDAAIAEMLGSLLTPAEQERLDTLRATAGLDETGQRDLARLEDKRLRGPLTALLLVIAEQAAGLEENIEQFYDDQFIETCAPWVVPYIGDLIGYQPLEPRLSDLLGSARPEVANTIRFRRRKGTAAVLEELAVNVTGWDAAVVEFFLRLATTQYLNHLRLDRPGPADLRRVEELELIGGAFDPLPHTADVRRIGSARGRYNIPNVGLFLWRVGSQTLTDAPAFQVDDRRYMFNPLGANTQLFNAAERATDVTQLADPFAVPQPITRRMLRRHLARLYGPGNSLTVAVGGHVLGVDEVEACDLSDTGPDPQTSAWAHTGQTKAAVDPVLGRLMLPAGTTSSVVVSFYYGFTADIGGGEYDRTASAGARPEPVRAVPADEPDIGQAVAFLGGAGTVEITGSGRYRETPVLHLAANKRLELRAANGSRPVLQLSGDLVVTGGDSSELILDGLLISGGRLLVPAQVNGNQNRLQRLRLMHCTLVPGGRLTRHGRPGSLATSVEVEARDVALEVESSILGALRVVDGSSATLADSIVDGLAPRQVAYEAPGGTGPGGPLTVNACTIIGKLRTAQLTASDSILHAALGTADTWNAPVIVERRQAGYVRYSYVPPGAQLPPRYAAQPPGPDQDNQLVPRFASLRYGEPDYCQLSAGCPAELCGGAADGGEMGAFHHLYARQREAGLRVRLDEYLRFGLEAGLFYSS
jgi:hypothetical protein